MLSTCIWYPGSGARLGCGEALGIGLRAVAIVLSDAALQFPQLRDLPPRSIQLSNHLQGTEGISRVTLVGGGFGQTLSGST